MVCRGKNHKYIQNNSGNPGTRIDGPTGVLILFCFLVENRNTANPNYMNKTASILSLTLAGTGYFRSPHPAERNRAGKLSRRIQDGNHFFRSWFQNQQERTMQSPLRFHPILTALSCTVTALFLFCLPGDPVEPPPDTYSQPDTTAVLSMLGITAGNRNLVLQPLFHPDTLNYTCLVADTTLAVQVTPSVSTDQSSTTIALIDGNSIMPQAWIGASPSYSLVYDPTMRVRTVTLIVTAQDGVTQKLYTVSVEFRPQTSVTPDSYAALSELYAVTMPDTDSLIKPAAFQPVFNADTMHYTLAPDSGTSVGLHPVAASANAVISVTFDNRPVTAFTWSDSTTYYTCKDSPVKNSRNYTITVTAADGVTKRTYTVIVTFRRQITAPLDSTIRLLSLDAVIFSKDTPDQIQSVPLQPQFSPGVFNYILFVNKSETAGVAPYVASGGSIVSVQLDGSIISPLAWSNGRTYYTCPYVSGMLTRQIIVTILSPDSQHTAAYVIDVSHPQDTISVPPDADAALSSLQFIAYDSRTGSYTAAPELSPAFTTDTLDYVFTSPVDTTLSIGVLPSAVADNAAIQFMVDNHPVAPRQVNGFGYYFCNYATGKTSRIITIVITSGDTTKQRTYTVRVRYNSDPEPIPPGKECLLRDMPMVSSLSYISLGRYGGGFYQHNDTNALPIRWPVSLDSSDFTFTISYAGYQFIGINPIPYDENSSVSVLLNGNPVQPRMWNNQKEYYTCTLSVDEDHLLPQTEQFEFTIQGSLCATPTRYRFTIEYKEPEIPTSVKVER